MIDFQRLQYSQKQAYNALLLASSERGCEYSFANLCIWGKQEVAFLHGCAAIFSHFHGRSLYPYPIGGGDRKAVLEAILQDAKQRGIPCRITGMTESDREELERWFPGRFHIRSNRDSFDYVYSIHDLADLRGKKLQSKRNHVNRFHLNHPDCQVVPLAEDNLPQAKQMVEHWFAHRRETDPHGDYLLENVAMARAFNHFSELQLEGIALVEKGQVLAVTMGSRLSADTFDIHFEKGLEEVPDTCAAVNCEFARYLRLKYPDVAYLNREDDLGIEGLRNAKLTYRPHHMVEKSWACLQEDIYAD